ncbi:microcin C transport system substrate-binding protein [Marinagarivorans cellulosilyticus]|uniref:Microcin C transport system substrate-binding protein n=1 Tax=Marinagarivorans cellulosilyticus TaxID=2721545 RepID=A0AAN2BLC5_9GAMM|nr:microcin C transport system substrate-binding protein [Marinagarivorans cellulosilyticus]
MPIRTLFVFCATIILSSACFAETIIKSHALTKYGTPKYPKDFTRFEYTSENAVKGGEVRISEFGSYDSLNYFIQKGVAERNCTLMYDSLMVSSADEPNTMYGLIAESIEYPKSKQWIIFNLNPKAKFSDGKAVTAEDIKFTFETLIEHGDPVYKMYFADVGKVEILSPHRIKFDITNPENKDLLNALAGLPAFPKHFWKGKEFAKSGLSIPMGSSAYKIERFDAGRSITYVRDKNYWAKDLNVNNGMYNFDKIYVEYYRDQDVDFEAFKAGSYDYLYEATSKTWATGYDIEPVHKGKIKRLEYEDEMAQGVSGIFFNLRKPMLKNRTLRQAMSLAFDFEWTKKNIFYGSYSRTNSFYENTKYAAQGTPSKEELALLSPFRDQLPPAVFGPAYRATETDGSGNNRKQLREAKKILDEAGYNIINGKLIDPASNKPVEMEIIIRQAGLEKVLNPWIANLKKIGIIVKLRIMDLAQWSNLLEVYDYDIVWLGFRGVDIPSNEQALLWGSENADVEGGANYMGIKNPAIDSIIKKLIAATNDEERIAAARALDRILTHSHYIVPLYHSKTNRLAFWDKFSYPEKRTTYDFRHEIGFYTWWYDEEKAKKLKQTK